MVEFLPGHFLPQHLYTGPYVEVYRYENYEKDLTKLVRQFEIDIRTIPHLNRSNHDHYSKYYTNETRDIVAELYKDDIELFGYKFETGTDS